MPSAGVGVALAAEWVYNVQYTGTCPCGKPQGVGSGVAFGVWGIFTQSGTAHWFLGFEAEGQLADRLASLHLVTQ